MFEKKTRSSASYSHHEINELALRMHLAASTGDLLKFASDAMRDAAKAEYSILYQMERRQKVRTLFFDRGADRVRFPAGKGIAGTVANENGYYICNDPRRDRLYVAEIDGIPGEDVLNLLTLCVNAGEEVLGVVSLINRKDGGGFGDEDAYYIGILASHAGAAWKRLRENETAWNLTRNIAEAVANAVDAKHITTVGHTERVRTLALAIGRAMSLTADEMRTLEFAALLHDIGRLEMAPAAPGGEDGESPEDAYAVERTRDHVYFTEAVLRNIRFPEELKDVRETAISHHELLDGSGFPRGKTAEQMSLPARILAVANTFDCLTSGRLGSGRMTEEEAARHLQDHAGVLYDAAVVRAMLDGNLHKFEKRRFPRYEYETPMEVTPLSGEGGGKEETPFETKALDVSEGGLLFFSERKLSPYSLVKLKIHLPNETIRAIAKIARVIPDEKGTGYRVGAYFMWYG
ncbi:MAG: HD domain-containing protein [Planctomycetota bacterium]|nr:HD domain-containing protein [Planctomycetota bacterium]